MPAQIPDWVPPGTGRPSASDLNDLSDARQLSAVADGSVVPITYGRDRVQGLLMYAAAFEEDTMIIAYAFGLGRIGGFEKVFVDDINVMEGVDPITGEDIPLTGGQLGGYLRSGNRARGADINGMGPLFGGSQPYYLGTTTQLPDPWLFAVFNGNLGRDYTDTLAGIAYLVFKIPTGINIGFPRVEAVVRGRCVYDPRLDSTNGGSGGHRILNPATWEYSANPTLCFADFATQHAGREVDWPSIIDGAYANDDLIGTFPDQQHRREIGLTLGEPRQFSEWVKAFRTYMGAFCPIEDGRYRVIPERADALTQGAIQFTGVEGAGVLLQDFPDVSMSQSFTIELWALVQTGAATQVLIAKKALLDEADAGWCVHVDPDRHVHAELADGSSRITLQSPAPVLAGQWVHIAVVLDRTIDEAMLLINGVVVVDEVDILTLGGMDNAVPLTFGAIDSGLYYPMSGQLDELRLWFSVRTPAEITSGMYVEVTLPPVELVGYWKCNGNVPATILEDSSQQSRDGAILGSAAFIAGNSLVMPSGVTAYFGDDDILDESMRISYRGVRQFPTVIEIEYTDETNDLFRSNVVSQALPGVGDINGLPRRVSRISLPGIHRHAQAVREAVERLNWFASNLEVQFTAFDEGIVLQHGAIIAVTHRLGLTTKLMRVTGLHGASGRWDIVAREYDPQIYSNLVITSPTYPDTYLPDPLHPPMITGLSAAEELFQQRNSTWASRLRISWAPVAYQYLGGYRVEVYTLVDGVEQVIFEATTSNYTLLTTAVDDFVDAGPVTYTVRVRVLSTYTMGQSVTTTVVVQGKWMRPTDVPQLTLTQLDANTVRLSWLPASDIDIWQYEVRHAIGTVTGGSEDVTEFPLLVEHDDTIPYRSLGVTATSSVLGYRGPTVSGGGGTVTYPQWLDSVPESEWPPLIERRDSLELVVTGLALGSHRFYVKAVDTVRLQSVNAITADITLTAPLPPTGVAGFEAGGVVRLEWVASESPYVERYRITVQEGAGPEETVDVVDGLHAAIIDLLEGTYVVRVYARTKTGDDGESAASIPISVVVTSDANVYLADFYDFSEYPINPSSMVNVHSWSLRDLVATKKRWWVTNDGSVFTSTSFSDHANDPLANYHQSIPTVSAWVSEIHDFEVPVTGTWNLDYAQYITSLSGTPGDVTVSLQLSSNGIDFTDYTSGVVTTARYARIRVSCTGSATFLVETPRLRLRVVVNPIEEGGEVTTFNSGTYYTVVCSRRYSRLLDITITPYTTGSPGSRVGVPDTIILNDAGNGNLTTFRAYLFNNLNQAQTGPFFWRVRGIV